MIFIRWTQTLFTILMLTVTLMTGALGLATVQAQPAIAASLTVPPTLANTSTALERRANATADQVGGGMQESLGKAVDSPANQLEGRSRRLSGEVRNAAEDAKETAQDMARATKEEGESLVDRVKDFFEGDRPSDQADTNVTGSRRTGEY